jgi:hypothetical protein
MDMQGVPLSSTICMDVQKPLQGYSFPPPAVWVMGMQGVSLYITCSMDVQGVFISTFSIIDVHGVSLSTASNLDMYLYTSFGLDVQGVSLSLPAV